ncbi:hypothetical protein CU097_001225, partial [Rhizopus azygosporus]
MCLTCFKPKCQDLLAGSELSDLRSSELKEILSRCDQMRPYYVVKLPDQCGAYVHFVNEVDAVTFFWRYALQEGIICRALSSVTVRPTLTNGALTVY